MRSVDNYEVGLSLECSSFDKATRHQEKRSLIHSLPTSLATPATPQSAAVIAGCDRTLQDERMRSQAT
jgi:hypothetical protein